MHTHECEISADSKGIEEFMALVEKIAEQDGTKNGYYRLSHAIKAMGLCLNNFDLRIEEKNKEIQKLEEQVEKLTSNKIIKGNHGMKHKPCPFCGSFNNWSSGDFHHGSYTCRIYCECSILGPVVAAENSEEVLNKAWEEWDKRDENDIDKT